MDPLDERLQRAIATCDAPAVKQWLVENKWRLGSIRDGLGRTPLHWAADYENYSISAAIELAMEDPYARDARGLLAIDYPPGEMETAARRILRHTFESHQRELENMLLPTHPSIVAEPTDSWRRKTRYRLLPDGKTALMMACEANRPDVVGLLLRSGASVDAVDWAEQHPASVYAIHADAAPCLQLLLEADPSQKDRAIALSIDLVPMSVSPLHLAAWLDKLQCLETLLQAGAAVDARSTGDRHSWTPLHLACIRGHVQAVQTLLAAGADPALAEAVEGFNALQLAMREQQDEVVQLLQDWAAQKSVNLLDIFESDPAETHKRFPLYRARINTVRGQCTICGAQREHCVGVDHLIAPCPACDRPRPWRADEAGEASRCIWCDRQGDWPQQWATEAEEIRVCLDCLRGGHAAVSHATDMGFLDPPLALQGMLMGISELPPAAKEHGFEIRVLETYSDGSQRMGVQVPQELLDDLMRTPRHPTLQDEHWTYHCGGWMVYLGKWEMQDFERQAPGRAREWLIDCFDDPDDGEMYWDWLEGNIGWSCVFRCPRCGSYKVFYDSD